jgi:hypothetical protein
VISEAPIDEKIQKHDVDGRGSELQLDVDIRVREGEKSIHDAVPLYAGSNPAFQPDFLPWSVENSITNR